MALEQHEGRKIFSLNTLCQERLAFVDCMQGSYTEARAGTQDVIREFERLYEIDQAAYCLQDLSLIDLRRERYEDAWATADKADIGKA
ncbi:hypothetical protein FRB96_006375 [Tulasnella sp. 330]|nr:hypothetical protein FRB96_006375 [Tulasnella sp. 330]